MNPIGFENNKDKKQARSGVWFDFLALTTIINYLLNFKALKLIINIVGKIRCLFTINYLLHMFYNIRYAQNNKNILCSFH